MRLRFKVPFFLLLLLVGCARQQITTAENQPAFTSNWEFALEGGDWQPVLIPHDWSVLFPFDSVNGEGATGYLPGVTTSTSRMMPVTYPLDKK